MATRGHGDIDSLPQRAAGAEKAVRSLSGAFNDLARSGSVSNENLVRSAKALEALGPAGQIASVALGGVLQTYRGIAEAATGGMVVSMIDLNRELTIQARIMAEADGTYKSLNSQFRQLVTVSIDLAEEEEKRRAILSSTGLELSEQMSLWNLVKNGMKDTGTALNGVAADTREALIASAAHTRQLLVRRDALNSEVSAFQANESAMDSLRRRQTSDQLLSKALGESEIELLRRKRSELEEVARLQAGVSGVVAASTSESIAGLTKQIDLYEDIAQIADTAIAGTAAGAFNAYADALDETISLNQIFAGGFDRSMRNMAASVVRSVGQQAAIKGAFEIAESIAAFARYDVPGGTGHLKAAGVYFSVAALAGVAAGATSVKSASGGGGGGGGGRGGSDDGKAGGPSIYVTVIGALDTQARKDLGAQLREEFYEGG